MAGRFSRGSMIVALALAGAQAGTAHSASASGSILGTPGQIAAERRVIALLRDPKIKAAQATVRAELAATPVGRTPEGAALLDRAIRQWTTSFIIREIAGDPARPQILWFDDNTPHSWHGHSIDMAVAGDNPDHIYRTSTIDGSGRYEIVGKVDPAHRPVQFSFEATRRGQPLRQTAGSADMGAQIHMLTDQDIKVEPDGSFRLTVGGPGDGPNHLRTVPGPVGIGFRDVLSDWSQHANRLTIRRLDKPAAKPRDDAALHAHILAGLPDYLRFWARFKDKWLGGLQPNAPVGPVARDGSWGYMAGARYVLAPDEAAIITTTRGAARYTGIQVTDAWMVAADGARHQTSINLSQAKPDPDGTYSYVLSPTNPGVANWLDTAGVHDGYLLLRWQGFEPGSTSDGLLKSYRVVKIADLKSVLPSTTAWVTPEQQAKAIAVRAADYRKRQE
ncbi:MAG: hypothetical protein ABW039_03140 [Sphingobium sp.]